MDGTTPRIGGVGDGRRIAGACLLVAAVATGGSLYYSLGLGLYPCELCWYQRILMYPLVVVLGYATLVGWADVHRVVLPLALPGLAIALYHSALQLSPSASCSIGGCGGVQLRVLGLSIPNQSALAFALIVAGTGLGWLAFRRSGSRS